MQLKPEIQCTVDELLQQIHDEAEEARDEGNDQLADVFDSIADNIEAAIRADELQY